MPGDLDFCLKPFLALGILTHEGVLGYVGLLLRLVLFWVLGLHVLLQISPSHAAPPNILVQTDLTFESVIPQMTVLDVSV